MSLVNDMPLTCIIAALTSIAAIPEIGAAASVLAAPETNDLARHLADELKYDNLAKMRTAGLERAQLHQQPWSGWYWPLNEGGLAFRYGDPGFPSGADWPTISNYLLKNIGKGPASVFSPAEKYDLLLGDKNFTLTRSMIRTAGDHAVGGAIEAWLGFCTGWANASMMLPRPVRSVIVTARDGKTKIEFLPSDIKALGALLWANGFAPARVVGNVCGESPVRRDPVSGRALDIACRDTNPATFHLSMTNQVGFKGRSMLIDSDSGYQIWNQPVTSYSYSYFDPETGLPASFEDAVTPLKAFKTDPFKGLRAPGAKYVVGVETHLTFVYETRPNLSETDSPAADELRYPIYKYDLELDSAGRIIGGEWRTRLHPDVLWVAVPGSRPATKGDSLVNPADRWDPEKMLPASWAAAAKESESYDQPLGVIVDTLFAWASE